MQASPSRIAWRQGAPLPEKRPCTLPELITRAVDQHGDRTVLLADGEAWSWQRLERSAAALAHAWQGLVAPGGCIALLSGNSPEHLLVEMAAWRLGAVAAPLPIQLPQARILAMLATCQPQLAYIADPRLAALAPPGCRVVGPEQLRSELGNVPLAQREVQGCTPCLIQLTSGSSGVPRGVVLSHDNLASQQAAYALLWPEVGPGDRIAAYLPWHHSFGGQAERLWALLRGVEVHLVPGGGRDRVRFCASLRQVAPTLFMSVPKMHAVALQEGLFRPRQLRWAFTAGATLPEACWQGYEQLAIRVHEGWGLTESSPSAAISAPHLPRVPGVVGPPLPGVAVGVEEGSGRIFIHGPNVMLRYAGGARSPLRPCERGGVMLESGDLGAWDAAGLRLLGREDCMLKLGNGEKVWAPTIEAAVIQRHPHALVLVEDGVLACVIEAPAATSDAQLVACIASANARIEASCQRIVRLYRLEEAMSVENGMLTASLKIARGAVTQAWRDWRLRGGRLLRELALPNVQSGS